MRDLAGHAEPRRFLFFDPVVGLIAFGRLRHCGSTQAVRRVFHLELRCASGIEPLREEPGELIAVILLGDGAEIIGGRGFSRVFGGELTQCLVVFVFSEHPAQHVQDHRSLVGGERLKFGGEGIKLARA